MLTIECRSAIVQAWSDDRVSVECDGIDLQDFIGGMLRAEQEEVLEAIGRDEAIRYFGIKEMEEK